MGGKEKKVRKQMIPDPALPARQGLLYRPGERGETSPHSVLIARKILSVALVPPVMEWCGA